MSSSALTSELSGNLIDICPVGALTAKPYAFVARPWELTKTDGIDVLDAVGSNIRIDSRGPEVLRILPRLNEDVNEEWIADKSRFSIDGLKRRRLDRPWLRRDGKLVPASWAEAFARHRGQARGPAGRAIGAIAGDLCDAESMVALKDLMGALGSENLDCRQDGARLDAGRRDFYMFNTSIAGIEEADALLHRRQQSAPRGAGPQCAHPQALARRRFRGGGDRPRRRTDLRRRLAGRGPSVLSGLHDGRHDFAKMLQGRQEADDHRRAGRAGAARWRGGAGGVLAAGGGDRHADARTGTASTCCIPRRPGSGR